MAGDDELDAIYLANGSDALRLAFLLTGNRETAEDIAQEAFVRLGGRILGFRDSGHARAYLFRIIVNLARGRGRKLTLERVALQKVRPSEVAVAPDLGERDQLWSALRSVPKRQRAALFLRYYLRHVSGSGGRFSRLF